MVVGGGSLSAGISPAELTSCHSATTATGLSSRYQPRLRRRRARAGGEATGPPGNRPSAIKFWPNGPTRGPVVSTGAPAPFSWRAITPVSAVSGMGEPQIERAWVRGRARRPCVVALSPERSRWADRTRWTACPGRYTGALRAARGDPCHHHRAIAYNVNRFYRQRLGLGPVGLEHGGDGRVAAGQLQRVRRQLGQRLPVPRPRLLHPRDPGDPGDPFGTRPRPRTADDLARH